MAFLNVFFSYLFVYIIFALAIVASVFAGIAVRKKKNKKDSELETNN